MVIAFANDAEKLPAHPVTRLLQSGRLMVEVDDPGATLPDAIKPRIIAAKGSEQLNSLTVANSEIGQSVVITASLPSTGVDLWSTGKQLSPEMLVLITIPPGSEKTWTRTYTFSLFKK